MLRQCVLNVKRERKEKGKEQKTTNNEYKKDVVQAPALNI